MSSNLHYYLAAAHMLNIPPRNIHEWLSVMPSLQALFDASLEEILQLGVTLSQLDSLRCPDWQQVDDALKWAQHNDCHILTLEDMHYPQLLREISDPPLVLFVQGDADLLSSLQIAIVGSRNVSEYGSKHAFAFAEELSRVGLVITSGLARGVDAASHRGTLSAGGRTIAVAGTGLLRTYPNGHRALAADIVTSGGALVSEFPLTLGPLAYNFPRRNRIISGMSRGVLVIEAAIRSGSLVTARHAVEQGRDVFALPGSISSPLSRGCHSLIRQGAKLVESPADILEEIGLDFPSPVEISPQIVMMPETLPVNDQKVYDLVGLSVTSMDEIILRSGLTASAVSSILLSIELKGLIKAVAGGYIKVTATT